MILAVPAVLVVSQISQINCDIYIYISVQLLARAYLEAQLGTEGYMCLIYVLWGGVISPKFSHLNINC